MNYLYLVGFTGLEPVIFAITCKERRCSFYSKSKYSNRNLIKIGKELKIDIEGVFICGG